MSGPGLRSGLGAIARVRRSTKLALPVTLAFGLCACSTIEYGWQALVGHAEVLAAARPVTAWIDDASNPYALRVKLKGAARIREFASLELGLPDNGSYRSYADLHRAAVVWSVFAADPFSVTPKTWCFPVAGCVPYRGYYDRTRALAFARELEQSGLETYVGAVPAYSTLGWFDDPLLNTFIAAPEPEVARLVFHELAHQLIYVKNDTEFNESFAVAVETIGVGRWLERIGSEQEKRAWEASRARQAAIQDLLLAHQQKLRNLFEDSRLERNAMRQEKLALTEKLRADYASLKAQWGGDSRYDRYFAGNLNNAQLASFAVYTHLVPAFLSLYADQHSDLPAFYSAVRQLAELTKEARTSQLKSRLTNNRATMAN